MIVLSLAISSLGNTDDSNALKTLVDNTPNVEQLMFRSLRDSLVTRINEVDIRDGTVFHVVKFKQSEMYVANEVNKESKKDQSVRLVIFNSSTEFKSYQYKAQTHYLPYEDNSAAYTHLDHIKWGNWFITKELSGCDIWIARDVGGQLEPIIMHINANAKRKNPENAFKQKAELAFRALEHINKNLKDEYTFVHRIYYKYEQHENINAIEEYWDEFQREQPKINCSYYFQGTISLFYGAIESRSDSVALYHSEELEAWDFVLKSVMHSPRKDPIRIRCPLKEATCYQVKPRVVRQHG